MRWILSIPSPPSFYWKESSVLLMNGAMIGIFHQHEQVLAVHAGLNADEGILSHFFEASMAFSSRFPMTMHKVRSSMGMRADKSRRAVKAIPAFRPVPHIPGSGRLPPDFRRKSSVLRSQALSEDSLNTLSAALCPCRAVRGCDAGNHAEIRTCSM